MEANLIIFIKNPVLGRVKTRLAKDIGALKALKVYQDLLAKTREETNQLNVKRYLYYSDNITSDQWQDDRYIKKLQKGCDLGERIKNAFEDCFSNNLPTIIIGSDCYDLKFSQIDFAFKKLQENKVVIGPANDGGYYLLGMAKFIPDLFDNIHWSTSTVFKDTLSIANRLDLTVFKMEELIDLDTFDDIEKSSYQLQEIWK